MPDEGKRFLSPDFTSIDKFFANVDFLVPDYERSSQYMVAIHKEFYLWARGLVAGKVVLEAGCGEGYGAAVLSETAQRVVGIDIKPELVEHARRRYPLGNAEFTVMDCEGMTFPPHSFDVVVCDELIEHLPHYEAFMRGAARVLRPGGIFVAATTNAEVSFKKADGSPRNRNHFQEFSASEFRDELKKYYGEVDILSEVMGDRSSGYVLDKRARGIELLLVRLNIKHKIPIAWRNRVRELITGVKVQDVVSEGFEIVEGAHDQALYVIGCGIKS